MSATKNTVTAPEALWTESAQDIPQAGLSTERTATADELQQISEALELIACRSLRGTYVIAPVGSGRYRLTGTLIAEVEQACVVTLEPLISVVEESFDLSFWPEDQMPAPASGEIDIDDQHEPEPIVAGRIEVGRVVFECLASAIEPFPRKSDAVLETTSKGPAEPGGSQSPFAVLAHLKTQR